VGGEGGREVGGAVPEGVEGWGSGEGEVEGETSIRWNVTFFFFFPSSSAACGATSATLHGMISVSSRTPYFGHFSDAATSAYEREEEAGGRKGEGVIDDTEGGSDGIGDHRTVVVTMWVHWLYWI
jgi:hypothetical protein